MCSDNGSFCDHAPEGVSRNGSNVVIVWIIMYRGTMRWKGTYTIERAASWCRIACRSGKLVMEFEEAQKCSKLFDMRSSISLPEPDFWPTNPIPFTCPTPQEGTKEASEC